MAMATRVVNLATGKEQFFSPEIGPDRAVIAAYEQDKGNWNTWTYPEPSDHPQFVRGYISVSCGNFAVYIEGIFAALLANLEA